MNNESLYKLTSKCAMCNIMRTTKCNANFSIQNRRCQSVIHTMVVNKPIMRHALRLSSICKHTFGVYTVNVCDTWPQTPKVNLLVNTLVKSDLSISIGLLLMTVKTNGAVSFVFHFRGTNWFRFRLKLRFHVLSF